MSPSIPVPNSSVGGSTRLKQGESTAVRFVSAGTADIAEVIVFHPIDTIAKRLMSNQSRITSASQLDSVIFKNHAVEPFGRRFSTLFPGLGYAAAYKVSQDSFDQTFGRGVSLAAKLRAYNIQDMGHGTLLANLMLGHGADERSYEG